MGAGASVLPPSFRWWGWGRELAGGAGVLPELEAICALRARPRVFGFHGLVVSGFRGRTSASCSVCDASDPPPSLSRAMHPMLWPQQHFTGVEVVNDVLSQLEDYESIGTKKLSAKESDQIARDLGTAVVVSEKEILIVHKERKELLSKDSVASITFFTVIPMNKEYETVAYITRNMRLVSYVYTGGTRSTVSHEHSWAELCIYPRVERYPTRSTTRAPFPQIN